MPAEPPEEICKPLAMSEAVLGTEVSFVAFTEFVLEVAAFEELVEICEPPKDT